MGGGDLKHFCGDGIVPGSGSIPVCPDFFPVFSALLWELSRNGEKENKGPQIPFGPAIALAFYAMLLYGDGLVNWYMALL